MSWWKRWFGSDAASTTQHAADDPNAHAVLVYFDYGSTDLSAMFDLETELEAAIEAAGIGEFDGNEIAVDGSDGTFFMYGPDADALFAVVRPVLESAPFMRGARVVLRYGSADDEDARESRVTLA